MLIALVGFVAAVPIDSEPERRVPQIIRNDIHKNEDGSFDFVYETDDGNYREEKGVVINPNAPEEERKIAVTGLYRYINDEGKTIETHYTADENGFVPSGADIPAIITKTAQEIHDSKH